MSGTQNDKPPKEPEPKQPPRSVEEELDRLRRQGGGGKGPPPKSDPDNK